MTNTVELTPAELEMIKVKREQEALAKKEAEAKQAIQLEKDIKEREAYIAKVQKQDAEQVAAAKEFANELGGMYKLVISDAENTVQVMGDYINRENGFDRHILWSKTFTRQTARITRSQWWISVEEHITYSSKWSTRGTSQGYKMQLHGPEMGSNNRHYTRTAKVNELIKDAIDTIAARKKHEDAKKNALETTVDRFKAEYPDAEVTTDKGWESAYGKRSYNGVTYDMVRIKFANGCSIAYRVWADGSLGRVSFNLPGAKDEAAFRKNLSQMKF
jgi:hypothetical protein